MTSSSTPILATEGKPAGADARSLDGFLAGVEQRAYRIARYGVRHEEDALDIVQNAMLKLATRYARRPHEEWTPLFYRILQNGIKDHHRRQTSRNRWLTWFDQFRGGDEWAEGPASGVDSYADEGSLDGERQLEVEQGFSAVNTAIESLQTKDA